MQVRPGIASVMLGSLLFAMGHFTRKVHLEQTPCATAVADEPSPNNVHYVGLNGSDSNTGSSIHPWATIKHADSFARPGDTVIVLDGIYRGDISLTSSGRSEQP